MVPPTRQGNWNAGWRHKPNTRERVGGICDGKGFTGSHSPLLGGAYTRSDRSFAEQYLGPDTDARLAALNTVVDEEGATPNQVVLAWMAQSEPAAIPLVAASTVEQMEENLGARHVRLSDGQMARLNAASG